MVVVRESVPGLRVMKALMTVNPLTYGVGAMRYTLYGEGSAATAGLPSMWICLGATALFALSMFLLGTMITLRRTSRDAQ